MTYEPVILACGQKTSRRVGLLGLVWGANRAGLVRVALCFTVIRSAAEMGSQGSAMKFYNRDEFIWTAKLGLCYMHTYLIPTGMSKFFYGLFLNKPSICAISSKSAKDTFVWVH